MFQANRDGFLQARAKRQNIPQYKAREEPNTNLADSQMTEPTNQLGLVKRIRSHLHPAHGLHLFVHVQKQVFGDLNLQVWFLALERVERVFVQFDREWFFVISRGLQLGCVCGGLDSTNRAETTGNAGLAKRR